MIWLWVESNHQPRAYETLALIPFELHSRVRILEARGGVEPRAFPPSSYRFGLEDRRRERGPGHCRFSIANCQLPIGPVKQQCVDANLRK